VRPHFRTAAETARLLGLTVKALRVYERHGLVRPRRTAAGWRVYGPDEVLRLHQIAWLKRLGLQLTQIWTVLHDGNANLDRILAFQEEDLRKRKRHADQALRFLRVARAKLARGGSLSPEDLITLTKETAMTKETPNWAKKIKALTDHHLSASDKEQISKLRQAHPEGEREWEQVIAEAKSLLGTDPGAPAALEVARKWNALVTAITGGNPEMQAKLRAVWHDAFADQQLAPSLPFTLEVMQFIRQASSRLETQVH
jgi:DNA-binding transcriptional MerR regulator